MDLHINAMEKTPCFHHIQESKVTWKMVHLLLYMYLTPVFTRETSLNRTTLLEQTSLIELSVKIKEMLRDELKLVFQV